MLSRYVFATTITGEPVYYHLVLKQHLPQNTEQAVLAAELFLEGSERAAIDKYLHRHHGLCNFTVVPSWECNLRCNHCSVLHKLVRHDARKPNAGMVADFLNRYTAHTGIKTLSVVFVGGEPLLELDFINEVIDLVNHPQVHFHMTTNLAMELTEACLACLRRLYSFTVSLDGLPDYHNQQRHLYRDTGDDPFTRTWSNLKTIIKTGMLAKLTVQAALADEVYTQEHEVAYYRMLMKLGLPIDRILFRSLHPTTWKPEPEPSFVQRLGAGKPINDVCCKYRTTNWTISDDGLYSDSHTRERIGTLTDPIPDLFAYHFDNIITKLPVLHDPKCKQCPVLGACWGGCTNGSFFVGDRPSAYCNQAELITTIEQRALAGTLIGG